MRISDWSSDVCSSDLGVLDRGLDAVAAQHLERAEQALALRVGDGCALGVVVEAHPGAGDGQGEDADASVSELHQVRGREARPTAIVDVDARDLGIGVLRSEEHTSELQSLMRISYAVFCLKKTNITQ